MSDLVERVRLAPLLRRAPALRDEIIAALERIPELEGQRHTFDVDRQREAAQANLAESERDAMQRRAEAAEADWQAAEKRADRVERERDGALGDLVAARGLLLRAGTALLAAMHGQPVDDSVLNDIEAVMAQGLARDSRDG